MLEQQLLRCRLRGQRLALRMIHSAIASGIARWRHERKSDAVEILEDFLGQAREIVSPVFNLRCLAAVRVRAMLDPAETAPAKPPSPMRRL